MDVTKYPPRASFLERAREACEASSLRPESGGCHHEHDDVVAADQCAVKKHLEHPPVFEVKTVVT
jgi:hypothetical protein